MALSFYISRDYHKAVSFFSHKRRYFLLLAWYGGLQQDINQNIGAYVDKALSQSLCENGVITL